MNVNSEIPGAPRAEIADLMQSGLGRLVALRHELAELRETLGDTKVRETTFAEFLAELKKVGKPVG